MSKRGILGDILSRVNRTAWLGAGRGGNEDLISECQNLVKGSSEVSGLVLAQDILERFDKLSAPEVEDFFIRLSTEFGVDEELLQKVLDEWKPGDINATRKLHFLTEPRSQTLIRALARIPGATSKLVKMREKLLPLIDRSPELAGLDQDFRHLFKAWFTRGFLEIRQIDWSTPASILEKIISYEAVHEITGWDDLRQRVGDPDRRLFAFFHPAMPSDPLIFVEVALTDAIAGAIGPILERDRERVDPYKARAAIFYSISNCQAGLKGISFGNFLIKQVVSELADELPQLEQFVTLSPVPRFRLWLKKALENSSPLISNKERSVLEALKEDEAPDDALLGRLVARYLKYAKHGSGSAFDPVAHFHLGNGAILHRIHINADKSKSGIANSWGVMVNYLYEGKLIEAHHQAYANTHKIAVSPKVKALADAKPQ